MKPTNKMECTMYVDLFAESILIDGLSEFEHRETLDRIRTLVGTLDEEDECAHTLNCGNFVMLTGTLRNNVTKLEPQVKKILEDDGFAVTTCLVSASQQVVG